MNWLPVRIRFDLSEPQFLASLSKEGEFRRLSYQARPSKGEFLTPSPFNDPGVAPWRLHDFDLKYIEEGQVNIWEGPSESGHLGGIIYLPPFEGRPDGCFQLEAWVSRGTFQFLLDGYRHQMDCRLTFTCAPKDQDVVTSYYDEFTNEKLTAWDTAAEREILAGQMTIEALADHVAIEGAGKAPVVHKDASEEEPMIQEVTAGLLP
ncbi:MAG TPA: hypothetical protein VI542_09225, partial [Candidatus Tectomicrobia bacterium]